MKRFAFLVIALTISALGALAADFTGFVSDANCAAKNGKKAATEAHANCAEACIKKGTAAVLITPEGKVYKLDDQAKVVDHAGHKVTVSGTLDGDTIKVDSVKMAS
jgi:hypothetical protein